MLTSSNAQITMNELCIFILRCFQKCSPDLRSKVCLWSRFSLKQEIFIHCCLQYLHHHCCLFMFWEIGKFEKKNAKMLLAEISANNFCFPEHSRNIICWLQEGLFGCPMVFHLGLKNILLTFLLYSRNLWRKFLFGC